MGGRVRIKRAVSAGGVVYREDRGALLVALCGRTGFGLWALPKGTPEEGESIEQTALREVREETGLEVETEAPLGHVEYQFTRPTERVHKRVHFFLMRERGGSVLDHDAEFDVVEWAPASEALGRLTHPTDREILRRAMDALDAERPR